MTASNPANKPRLEPLSIEELDDDALELLGPYLASADTHNILLTLIRQPALLRSWLPLSRYVFNQSSLDPLDVELVCLRSTYRCRAAYEFTHHVRIAEQRGLSTAAIEAIAECGSADALDDRQRLLLKAVDDLLENFTLSNALWAELSEVLRANQLLDLVATCGNYSVISMIQNAANVQLEEGIDLHAAFAPSAS